MRYTIMGDDGTVLVLLTELEDAIIHAEDRAAATGHVQRLFEPGNTEPVHVTGVP